MFVQGIKLAPFKCSAVESADTEANTHVQPKHEAGKGTRVFAWKQGRARTCVRTHASPKSAASGEAGPAALRALKAAAGRHFLPRLGELLEELCL